MITGTQGADQSAPISAALAAKLGKGEGVMPSMPWAPKRSRDRAQHGRAAGKVSANVEHRCTSAARAKQRRRPARKRNALLT